MSDAFKKKYFRPRLYAETEVLEAFRALSLGFYNVFLNHYKTVARVHKISLWAQTFEFQLGIQGVFDERAQNVS